MSANRKDAYRFVFLEKTLPQLIERHNASRLIVLGDLTDQKDSHPAPLVNRVVDGFAALADLVEVIVLKANHDYVSQSTPFFRFLNHLDNMRWINEPAFLRLHGLGRCLFLPHTTNWERDWKGFSFDADWIFTHQTFSGAVSESGQKMDGIPRDVFPRGARVVSGDVHVPQKVGCVTYVGAPFRINFGDDFEPRVLLLDGDEMRSVPVEGPQKRLVTTTILGKFRCRDADIQRGDVVKVQVELPTGSDLSRAKVRAAVREWAAEAGVEIYETKVSAPRAEKTEKAIAKRDRRSDADLVRAYAKKMGKGKVTEAAGLKIMEEVT